MRLCQKKSEERNPTKSSENACAASDELDVQVSSDRHQQIVTEWGKKDPEIGA